MHQYNRPTYQQPLQPCACPGGSVYYIDLSIKKSIVVVVVVVVVAASSGSSSLCAEEVAPTMAIVKMMMQMLLLPALTASLAHVLHYTRIQSPLPATEQREPIIILHGLLGSSRNLQSWSQLLHSKLNSYHDIYLLDLRNHGGSVRLGPLSMSYIDMAKDVLTTADFLGIGKFHIIGHSLGGKVSASTALLDSRENLNRVRSVCLLDISPVIYDSDSDVFAEVSKTVEFLVQTRDQICNAESRKDIGDILSECFGDESLVSFLLANIQGAVCDPKQRQTSQQPSFEWKFLIDGISPSMGEIGGFPWSPQADRFNGPTLVYKAADSLFVRSSHIPLISSFFPSYTMISEKGAGHWLHIEKPNETTQKVAQFFNYLEDALKQQ